MRSKVTVSTNKDGAVIILTENPDIGYVILKQTRVIFKNTGWLKKQKLQTLVFGTVDELKGLNWFNGTELPGNILIKEQLDPFNETDPDRDYKIAGLTGIICCIDGQPIYRRCYYEPNSEIKDIELEHDNGEVIKEKFKEQIEEITSNQDLEQITDTEKTKPNKKKETKIENIDLG
jgi:hypothetical protein